MLFCIFVFYLSFTANKIQGLHLPFFTPNQIVLQGRSALEIQSVQVTTADNNQHLVCLFFCMSSTAHKIQGLRVPSAVTTNHANRQILLG